MPAFNTEGRRLYRDTRTLPWNPVYFVMLPADAWSGTVVIDPCQDVLNEPEDVSSRAGPDASPDMATLTYASERLPSTFRSAPGPGQGFFAPSGF